MSERNVVISIDKYGRTTIEANGFQGGECMNVTEDIRKLLMNERDAGVHYKPEYYNPSTSKQTQKQTQRW